MSDPDQNFPDTPVLILAPTGSDASNAAAVLAKAAIRSQICRNMPELCRAANDETGVLMVTEETLDPDSMTCLRDFLKHQPPWSDIPVVLLTRDGEVRQKVHEILNCLGEHGNVSLLERPLRAITLISVLKAALRSRRHQYEVRDLLESYSLAVEGAQLGSWDLDWKTDTSRRSLKHDQIFGYKTPQPHWGFETLLEHVLPADRLLVKDAFGRALAGEGLMFECRIQWPDESVHWVAMRGRVYANGEAEPVRIAGVVTDITQRKELEEAARIQRERMDLVLDKTEVGLWFWDLPSGKLAFNARTKELFTLSPDAEVSVAIAFEHIHPEDRERVQKAISEALEGKHPYDIDYRILGTTERWVRAIGRVFTDVIGKPLRFDGITMDITRRKQEEELLRRAQLQLEQTAEDLDRRVKERTAKLEETVSEMEAFSYSVSHDLRAPLRAMQGYSQVLLEQYSASLDRPGRNYLTKISQAAERLDRLTQDLLTYSRVVRAAITMTPIALENLVRDVIHQYPTLQQPAVEITIEGPLLDVMGHEASLIQCISNLLGNAVKFVLPGVKPRIRIWTERVDNQVRVNFEDNGIGIAPDQIHRIFKMFERVNKQYEGTGIGLAIVRKAAERMGGSVGVESGLGKGSKFWLQLPARES
jgi:PAS domain S-box-containing protein